MTNSNKFGAKSVLNMVRRASSLTLEIANYAIAKVNGNKADKPSNIMLIDADRANLPGNTTNATLALAELAVVIEREGLQSDAEVITAFLHGVQLLGMAVGVTASKKAADNAEKATLIEKVTSASVDGLAAYVTERMTGKKQAEVPPTEANATEVPPTEANAV